MSEWRGSGQRMRGDGEALLKGREEIGLECLQCILEASTG